MFLTASSNVFKMDYTINITTLLALCAIVSPILTALINNAHHTKIRRMEMQQDFYRETVLHQRDFFENYLKHAGRCIYHSDLDALKDYGEYYFSALSYADADLRSKMIKANSFIQKDDYENATPILEEITAILLRAPLVK